MAAVSGRPDGLDIRAEDYKEDVELHSDIAEFFAGKNVFVTGGTGFLGNLIIEKLLRACKINKIYMLIRPKKGKDPEKRFEEIFSGPVFDRVKTTCDLKEKVQIVHGDVAELSLGLSAEELKLIEENVHVILHGAATVKFDEKIRLASNINARGTLELLKIATRMPKLQSFLHISTAYSNCLEECIEEKIYPTPMSHEKLFNLIESSTDEMLDNITPDILGKYPNTYIFTKHIGENIVQSYSHILPVAIVRPSIIVGTANEPISGWINNVYGVTGIIVGAALGLIRTLYCHPNMIIDVVPADFVINCVIAGAYDVARKNIEDPKYLRTPDLEIPIFNCVSSEQNPIRLTQLMKFTEAAGHDNLSPKCVWHYCFTLNESYIWHYIYTIFLHFVPAIIVDFLAICLRKKPMMWKIYSKIEKFQSVLIFFVRNEFKFSDTKTKALFDSLPPGDKKLFMFDIKSLNWQDYFYMYLRGLRIYLVDDPMETLPAGQRKGLI